MRQTKGKIEMNSDIKENDEHATPHGLSSAESAGHERLVMRYPADNSIEPVYSVIQSCVIDNCLRKIERYFDEHGAQCGLGEVLADLRLMAAVKRGAIEGNV